MPESPPWIGNPNEIYEQARQNKIRTDLAGAEAEAQNLQQNRAAQIRQFEFQQQQKMAAAALSARVQQNRESMLARNAYQLAQMRHRDAMEKNAAKKTADTEAKTLASDTLKKNVDDDVSGLLSELSDGTPFKDALSKHPLATHDVGIRSMITQNEIANRTGNKDGELEIKKDETTGEYFYKKGGQYVHIPSGRQTPSPTVTIGKDGAITGVRGSIKDPYIQGRMGTNAPGYIAPTPAQTPTVSSLGSVSPIGTMPDSAQPTPDTFGQLLRNNPNPLPQGAAPPVNGLNLPLDSTPQVSQDLPHGDFQLSRTFSTPSATPVSGLPAPPNPYKVGARYGNLRYKGGDINSKDSWDDVK